MPQPVPGSTLGIDVSHWQGDINWQEVKAAGAVKWAYAKASTGETGRDKRWVQNAVDATKAGIPIGAYHWTRPGYNSPAKEAANFVGAIKAARDAGASVGLAPMIDLEEKPKAGTSKGATLAYVRELADAIESLGEPRPILYVGTNYSGVYLPDGADVGMAVWVPQYNVPSGNYGPDVKGPKWTNAITGDWSVWQYSSKGSVPGIKGSVDMNALRPGHEGAIGLGWAGWAPGGALALLGLAGAAWWARRKGWLG